MSSSMSCARPSPLSLIMMTREGRGLNEGDDHIDWRVSS